MLDFKIPNDKGVLEKVKAYAKAYLKGGAQPIAIILNKVPQCRDTLRDFFGPAATAPVRFLGDTHFRIFLHWKKLFYFFYFFS